MEQILKVEIELITEMLGTAPKDPSIYSTYVASQAPEEVDTTDEESSVEETGVEEKGWTGFRRHNGEFVVMDYMIKGFLKEACGTLRNVKGRGIEPSLSSGLTSYKKSIDGMVFVEPRFIPLQLPEGTLDENGNLPVCERSLRTNTPRGPRTALARSDEAPAGTKLSFTIILIPGKITPDLIAEWLNHGRFSGLGQWRSGGHGKFKYTMELVE